MVKSTKKEFNGLAEFFTRCATYTRKPINLPTLAAGACAHVCTGRYMRVNGKLTTASQAGLYNPEIKGVLYPEEDPGC